MTQGQLRTIGEFLRPYRWHLAGLMGLTIVLSVLAMLPPLLVRAVINRVIVGGDHALLLPLGIFMIATPLIHTLCGFLQVLGIAYAGQKFVMDVRSALYAHFMKLAMRFYGQQSTGKLVNRLMGDTGVLQNMLTVASVQIVSDLVCSIFAISVTFALNRGLAALLVVVVLLFVVNYRINIERIKRATRGYRSAEDRLAAGVQNRLVANLTIKTFGTERREQSVFRGQSDASLELVRESQYSTNTFTMNTSLLSDVGRIVIFFVGCAMVLEGSADYGDVVAFTAYAMQLLAPAVRFSMLAQQLQNVGISAERVFELLSEPPEVTSKPGAHDPGRVQGRIDFDHVFFSYEPERPILKDFDIHVEPGETVALVGPTGCGKSTVLSLLLRFFDVQSGAVRVDGFDVRDLVLGRLRRQFGIVLQESLLFNVSIFENIRYSRQSATMDEIVNAAKIAEIHDVVCGLPHGYASEVGHRDVQLSVGQKQRISIARAVLADPAILIMDEATSALDSESEKAIQTAMDRFLVGRTSFIVAHRLSTIRHADRIVLLDAGSIVETGNHEELMRLSGGRYRDLYLKHVGRGMIADE